MLKVLCEPNDGLSLLTTLTDREYDRVLAIYLRKNFPLTDDQIYEIIDRFRERRVYDTTNWLKTHGFDTDTE